MKPSERINEIASRRAVAQFGGGVTYRVVVDDVLDYLDEQHAHPASPPADETATGGDAPLRPSRSVSCAEALQNYKDSDPRPMTMGEQEAFRVGYHVADSNPCIACGCNCDPRETTGGGHRGDCPAYEPECTCYEMIGGHQPMCPYGAMLAMQKERHVTAVDDPPAPTPTEKAGGAKCKRCGSLAAIVVDDLCADCFGHSEGTGAEGDREEHIAELFRRLEMIDAGLGQQCGSISNRQFRTLLAAYDERGKERARAAESFELAHVALAERADMMRARDQAESKLASAEKERERLQAEDDRALVEHRLNEQLIRDGEALKAKIGEAIEILLSACRRRDAGRFQDEALREINNGVSDAYNLLKSALPADFRPGEREAKGEAR